jgi:hypothetical protein
MTVHSPQKSRSPTRRPKRPTCNTTQHKFAFTLLKHFCYYKDKTNTAHFQTVHTRTTRRGRPFRHRCVELCSLSLPHFNARLLRSFLKQPDYGPDGAGLLSHLSPRNTNSQTEKSPANTCNRQDSVSVDFSLSTRQL